MMTDARPRLSTEAALIGPKVGTTRQFWVPCMLSLAVLWPARSDAKAQATTLLSYITTAATPGTSRSLPAIVCVWARDPGAVIYMSVTLEEVHISYCTIIC